MSLRSALHAIALRHHARENAPRPGELLDPDWDRSLIGQFTQLQRAFAELFVAITDRGEKR